MVEKNKNAIEKIELELNKLKNNENNIYFFVIDTKGVPSGNLYYIYSLGKTLSELGKNVSFLYQEENEDFVGVSEWLGEEYAKMPHFNIKNQDVKISPADVLIIPEIFANVMEGTTKLPCRRIVLVQNIDFISEYIPLGKQWGDYGISEAIVNTKEQEEIVKEYFPYVKTHVIKPFINPIFFESDELKKMVINIVTPDQSEVNKIVKPFYWKYPMYKWVSFRDIRQISQVDLAEAMRESAITIWSDEKSKFGYSALEALKTGNILISKIPEHEIGWMKDDENKLIDCGLWYRDYNELHKMIAAVVRAWVTDEVPSEIFENAKKITDNFTYDNFKGETEKVFNEITEVSIENLNKLKHMIHTNNKNEEN